MATIPTPPTWAANDSSIANLQAIANCAKFLTVLDPADTNTLPSWHIRRTNTTTISSFPGVVVFNSVPFDTDGVFDGTGALIVTQGLYACESTVSYTGGSGQLKSYFQITTGASNPNHTAGSTIKFGNAAVGVSGYNETSVTCSDITPWVCYPGDKIYVYVSSGASVTAAVGGSTTGMTNRCWPTFTGRWHAQRSTP